MEKGKRINVLYVAHSTSLYGANSSLLRLMIELREKGVCPTVLLPRDDDSSGRNLTDELERHKIPYKRTAIILAKTADIKKSVAKYFYSLLKVKEIMRDLPAEKFDLVHSNSSVIVAGAHVAKKLGVPHVWHIREFGKMDYGLLTPFGKWFQNIMYGVGDNTFVAISNKIRSHYAKYVGHQKIELIYNGLPSMPQREKRSSEIVRFCMVGLLHEGKGQLEVLHAVDILANEFGENNFSLTIVGDGDADYTRKLKDFIRENKLEAHVSLTGRRDDVPHLLTTMDVGIMASSAEAFGRSTVEYMMAGLAVVASDSGANKEIVKDGVTGLIYSKGDCKALATKMMCLISDRRMIEEFGEAGIRVAMAYFSSAANSNAVYTLYKKILGCQCHPAKN